MKIFRMPLTRSNFRQIQKVAKYAQQHPVSFDRMERIASGEENPVGEDPNHVFQTQDLRWVFSYEYHYHDVLHRHLSISTQSPEEAPHPGVVNVIMALIGFDESLEGNVYMYTEEHPLKFVVNILEVVKTETIH